MIPIGGDLSNDTETIIEPTRTYKLDLDNGRVIGYVDGPEAVKQAVFKILQTDRFFHLIYDANYGSELNSLQGQSAGIVQSEMERLIREALLQDDRILDVQDISISVAGDEAMATFTVVSTYGSYTEEVKRNV